MHMNERHGNNKREKFRRHLQLCEVSCFVPPPELVAAARERTEGMVWLFVMESRSGEKWMEDLQTLVRSAYIQGAQDAADVAAKLMQHSN